MSIGIESRLRSGLWAVLAVALALRLLYLYQAGDTPLFEVLLLDSEFYDRQARTILAGDWLGDRVFFMNPFYPYFLALIYVLLGVDYWQVGLVQAIMGVASCALIFGVGRIVWSEKVGLVAATLAAVYGPYAFYDGALLTASPITFFNLAALYCLVRSEDGGTKWLWWAGVFFGLSATARPMVLLFVVLAAHWFWRRNGMRGMWQWGRVLCGVLAVIGIVVLRNYSIGGEWLLTTSSAGMNFYVGNHPGANGIYAQVDFLTSAEPDLEREAFIREAESRSGRTLSPAQASRFWLGEGLAFAANNPAAYLSLLVRKFYMFWNGVEAQNNLSIYFAGDFVPILRWLPLGWGLLAPLAIVGWATSRRGERPLLLDLYWMAYLLGCLLFFASSEYRLPITPVLMLYGARLIVECAVRARSGLQRGVVVRALLVVLVALPVNYRDAAAERLTLKRVDYYNFGTLYQRVQHWDMAEYMFRGSMAIDPHFTLARDGLANALVQQGKIEAAASYSGDPAAARGLKLFGMGKYSEAIQAFTQALNSRGDQPRLLNNLGLCHYRLGRFDEAAERFGKALAHDPDYAKAHFNLGMVHIQRGENKLAEMSLQRVLDLDPAYAKAHYRMGEVLLRLGRPEAAEGHWQYLLRNNPGDARLKSRLDSLQRTFASHD